MVIKLYQKLQQHPSVTLAFILLSGLALRLLLLPVRWINPDEGAHLMDARLLLQGLTPLVDFGSKQPFYIVLLAGAIKLFGAHLWVGRVVVILCQMATAWLLYAISSRLANRRSGLLAALLYSFYPFVVIWAPVVKTEPPAIMLAVLSVYFFLRALRQTDVVTVPFFLAGVAAGLAYYVRQSTLYLPLSVLLFLCFNGHAARNFRLAALTVYTAGFAAVCALVVLIYSRWLSFKEIIFSSVNPLELIFSRGLHVLGLAPAQYRIADSVGFRIMDQDMSITIQAWQDGLALSFCILLLLLFLLIDDWKSLRHRFRRSLLGFPVLWLATALMMYLFHSVQRGFFSQYFIEVLTPAILIVSCRLFRKEGIKGWMVLVAVSIFYLVMILLRVLHGSHWPLWIFYWLAYLVLLVVFLRRERPKWIMQTAFVLGVGLQTSTADLSLFWQMPVITIALYFVMRMLKMGRRNAAWGVIALAVILTAAYSSSRLGPRYECVWSPRTLQQVTGLLAKESKDATVLAGATIWAFESGLQPWLNIAHPTEVLRKFRHDFADQFAEQRPDFIILDDYTQRKYSRYWTVIQDELETHYEKTATFSESNHPVEVYRLLVSPVQPSSSLTQSLKPCR